MKKLILFTKDSISDRGLEEILAESYDCQIFDVGSCGDVWNIASSISPDIILVMSNAALDKDYRILKELQSKKTLLPSSVIVVAPTSPTDEEFKCLDYGAIDFIIAPYRKKLIVNRLEKLTNVRNSIHLQELEHILQYLPSNIFLKDAEGKYVFCTHYWHHLHGANEPGWTIRGKTDVEIRKDTENAKLAMEKDKEIIRTGKGAHYVIEENSDGIQEFLEIIKEPVRDENDNIYGIVALINNVTEQEQLKRKLRHMSITDELTGLYNRTYLHEVLNDISKEENLPLGFISADCNYLKQVNDYYGHLIGDEYIRLVGVLFRMVLPENAMFFRVGGDEFLAIIPKTSTDLLINYILHLKSKAKMLQIRGRRFSVAFGYSCMEKKDDDILKYLEKADYQMYSDKSEQKKRDD
ncbi:MULTISPECIES: sensor domain-containing diguanylate cyclase [unclassified Fibrobacter]|uniref:sensor domain-containing diguanylate cyclase n=1 Tax=unclassified Fibrobacter TaxID=2634177 RepID=UPI000D7B2EFF|nr:MULTISPECIES: sensor domain-containing diguanylate cyclase [unclassified Fibrobacter]PWJ70012.1 diguanylate cyclase (GGDEF)-like protein [Fibrobacter sp. UWR4]PZW73183.1 diguanylate cyclase (GGDEF)-like protein [Fibrobacter sp. UWR1]